MLGDLDRAFRSHQALVVLELERMDARDPQMGECEVGGGAFRLQCLACVLELLHGRVGLIELPLAAPEKDPGLRRLDRKPELLQLPDSLDEKLLGGYGLAVVPP